MRPGFAYCDGKLHAEGVPLEVIADAAGTPCHIYAAGAIRDRARSFLAAFAGLEAHTCYAVKANGNLSILRLLGGLGIGADVVSAGELERAMAAGIPANRIVFSGVGKSRAEMEQALAAGILQFNVESIPELLLLADVARIRGARAPVALRINPDVDAGTHEKISTGRRQDKFGIAYDDAVPTFDLASRLAGIDVVGLHLHIGSQILSEAPFAAAYGRALDLVDALSARGIALRRLDLGGGMGVPYGEGAGLDLEAYGTLVRRLIGDRKIDLVFEPGRFLVAEAGVMLARTLYVKDLPDRPCLILDAGMNDLLRPALYDARHALVPLAEPDERSVPLEVDIVGPICESTDVFARAQTLPAIGPDELVAFLDTGAYGAVMASDYNSRPLAAEVLVDGDRFAITRPRIEPRDRFQHETIAAWLGSFDHDHSPRGPWRAQR